MPWIHPVQDVALGLLTLALYLLVRHAIHRHHYR